MGDEADNEIDKIQSLRSLKEMISTYKCIVQSQDELLQKAIMKNNNYTMPFELEMEYSDFQVIKRVGKSKKSKFIMKIFLKRLRIFKNSY